KNKPKSKNRKNKPKSKNHKNKTKSKNRKNFKTAKDPKCKAGCPVDTATGAVIETRQDFVWGHTLEVVFTREYDSQGADLPGLFGRGWIDTFSERLITSYEDEHVDFYSASGEVVPFDIAAGTRRVFNPRFPYYTLIRQPRGFAIHDLRDDRTHHFELRGDQGRLTQISDAHGNSVALVYNGDLLTAAHHSDGLRLALRRVHSGRGTEHIYFERDDLPGSPAVARYTLEGGLLTEAQTQSSTLSYRYDSERRMARWSDSARTWATYEYDEQGRCVRSRAADGLYSIDLTYDDTSWTTTVRDGKGNSTTYQFNRYGQLRFLTDPLGSTRSWAYDRHGQLIIETNALGGATHHYYDPVSGQRVRTVDPSGHATEYEYDDDLRVIAVADALGQVWRYERGAAGEILAVTAPDGSSYTYRYDSHGRLKSIARTDGAMRTFDHDERGRLVRETDWLGHAYHYTYDARDRISQARDPLDRAETLFYDPRERRTAIRHGDGSQRRCTYDSEHNLTELTDENGHTARAEFGAFDLQ
ncbi:MAG TPA: DUF6531 domain-containing protein, partial [Nannocystaceae bacterium]|nr:DUF6531 domain-containing protein [Nannocystaceae bacterium]